MTIEIIATPIFDNVQAEAEGWGIFDIDAAGTRFQLQRGDELGAFESDRDAQRFVVSKARQGSHYHRTALAFLLKHSPEEHAAIYAALAELETGQPTQECWITLRFKGEVDLAEDTQAVAEQMLSYFEVALLDAPLPFNYVQKGDVLEIEEEADIYGSSKEPDDTPETLIVDGGGGTLTVDRVSGNVIMYAPSSEVPAFHEGYGNVVWVDLEEWTSYWGKPLHDRLDILDVRVKCVDGSFIDAEEDWRQEVKRAHWSGPTDSDGAPCTYINHYHCEDCDVEWTDQWSCACNDKCEGCGKEIEPYDSDELDLVTGDTKHASRAAPAVADAMLLKHASASPHRAWHFTVTETVDIGGAEMTALALLEEGRNLIEEAITTHIYDGDDTIPADCGYTAHVKAVDAMLKQASRTQPVADGAWEMSGPEEGDGDDTVLVCNVDANSYEVIKITAGTVEERKAFARRIAALLNEADAVLLG